MSVLQQFLRAFYMSNCLVFSLFFEEFCHEIIKNGKLVLLL